MTWRREFPVLVPDTHAVGNIAVVRSLGRAGYPVHACATRPEALGLQSNYATHAVVMPPHDSDEFLDWARSYVAKEGIRVIIPSEGFLMAIRPAYAEFSALLPLPNNPDVTYRAFSKIDVDRTLYAAPEELGFAEHLPPSLIASSNDPLPSIAEIDALGAPFFVKSDVAYCREGNRSVTKRVETAEETRAELERLFEAFKAVLVQGWVGGVKAAAAYCIDAQRVLTRTGVLGLRTNPHRGGMMSLRETWHHPTLSDIALAWLRYIDWLGVAMLECKWEPETNRFWLIEINSRYWGYLHLDLFSGIDVPRIQVDAFLGHPQDETPTQKLGVRCRHTLPSDIGHLSSKLRDQEVGLGEKAATVARFGLDFLDPRLHSDLMFPGDRKLYWLQLRQSLQTLGRKSS